MKYTTVNVQQLTNRKGKPWQARAKYKDVYGKWKEAPIAIPCIPIASILSLIWVTMFLQLLIRQY